MKVAYENSLIRITISVADEPLEIREQIRSLIEVGIRLGRLLVRIPAEKRQTLVDESEAFLRIKSDEVLQASAMSEGRG